MELGEIDVKQARDRVSWYEGRRWDLERDVKALYERIDGLETALWLQRVIALDGDGPALDRESDALARFAKRHAELRADIERRGRLPDDFRADAEVVEIAAEYVGECCGEVDGYVGVWSWDRAWDGQRAGEMWVELEPYQATVTAEGLDVEVRLCTHPRYATPREDRWVLGEGRLQVAVTGEVGWGGSLIFDGKYDQGWMRALSEMAEVQAEAAERAERVERAALRAAESAKWAQEPEMEPEMEGGLSL